MTDQDRSALIRKRFRLLPFGGIRRCGKAIKLSESIISDIGRGQYHHPTTDGYMNQIEDWLTEQEANT